MEKLLSMKRKNTVFIDKVIVGLRLKEGDGEWRGRYGSFCGQCLKCLKCSLVGVRRGEVVNTI